MRLQPGASEDGLVASIRRWKHLSAMTGALQEDILTRSVIEGRAGSLGLFSVILLIVSTVVIGLIVYTMTMDKKEGHRDAQLIGAPDRVVVALILQQALAMGLSGLPSARP